MTNTSNNIPLLHASIRTKSDIVYEGRCNSVTSHNPRGAFDVLPMHTNFITLIDSYVTVNLGLGDEKKFELEHGIMYVMSNSVNIYLGV